MLYGIDYRDMNSAVHHLLIYKKEKIANNCLEILKISNNIGNQEIDDISIDFVFNNAIDNIEVNYRELTEIYETRYHENINGMVLRYADKVKIINFEESIDIYEIY